MKRQILSILRAAKEARTSFKLLRAQYEGCKLKLRSAPKYQPLKGDEVDKLLADWIFANNCPIPISRMGCGYY
jgi:hypothetical protein